MAITTMKAVEIRHRQSACCQQVDHIHQFRTAAAAAAAAAGTLHIAAAEDDDADGKSAPKHEHEHEQRLPPPSSALALRTHSPGHMPIACHTAENYPLARNTAAGTLHIAAAADGDDDVHSYHMRRHESLVANFRLQETASNFRPTPTQFQVQTQMHRAEGTRQQPCPPVPGMLARAHSS